MDIRITKRAARQWAAQLRECERNFGQRTVLKAIDEFEKKLLKLAQNPEIGFPEPLLAHKPHLFRALILSRNTKAIYIIEEDCIEVVDIWDMRMNPEKLKTRIK